MHKENLVLAMITGITMAGSPDLRRAELMVCRLAAGGSRIRTIGTASCGQGFESGSCCLRLISRRRKVGPNGRKTPTPPAGLTVRILFPPAGSQYKPEFAPQVAGLGCHFEVVEPPRRRGSAQAIGMTGACFRSRNGACSRSGCCMFPLPGVHCGFLMRVPDTGMRHPSQSVKSLLWLR